MCKQVHGKSVIKCNVLPIAYEQLDDMRISGSG
jgi:hypothetical protein